MKIKSILKQTSWNEASFQLEKIVYIEKIKNKYSVYNFSVTDEIAEQLAHFYNLKITFSQASDNYFIKFDLKKSLKFKLDYLNFIAERLGEKSVVHMADIHPGYYSVWLGQSGKVYAEYEKTIILLGNSPFESMENLYQNKVKI